MSLWVVQKVSFNPYLGFWQRNASTHFILFSKECGALQNIFLHIFYHMGHCHSCVGGICVCIPTYKTVGYCICNLFYNKFVFM